ncbi:MAG: LysE family transporter, partial [Pseudomonadota bacterium]
GMEAPKRITPAKRQRTLRMAYLEGVLTNALNPKVSMFYLAAFPQFITIGETSVLSSFLLVSVHSALNALWFGVMVVLFASLTAVARSGAFQRRLQAVTGVVFIGFGWKLASYRPSV